MNYDYSLLPTELKLHIFQYLDETNLRKMFVLNKNFKSAALISFEDRKKEELNKIESFVGEILKSHFSTSPFALIQYPKKDYSYYDHINQLIVKTIMIFEERKNYITFSAAKELKKEDSNLLLNVLNQYLQEKEIKKAEIISKLISRIDCDIHVKAELQLGTYYLEVGNLHRCLVMVKNIYKGSFFSEKLTLALGLMKSAVEVKNFKMIQEIIKLDSRVRANLIYELFQKEELDELYTYLMEEDEIDGFSLKIKENHSVCSINYFTSSLCKLFDAQKIDKTFLLLCHILKKSESCHKTKKWFEPFNFYEFILHLMECNRWTEIENILRNSKKKLNQHLFNFCKKNNMDISRRKV